MTGSQAALKAFDVSTAITLKLRSTAWACDCAMSVIAAIAQAVNILWVGLKDMGNTPKG
jgi:hypothetical protein